MRRVIVTQREWQPPGRYVNTGEQEGLFHGSFQQTLEDGGQEPVILVEYSNGQMDTVYSFQVFFIDPPIDLARVEFITKYILEARGKYNCMSANDRKCLVATASELYKLIVEGVK